MSERRNARERFARRRFLSGLGAASVASTVGCLTTLPAFGQRVRFGEIEEPEPGRPVYRDWIPDDLGASDPPGSPSFAYHRPGERGEGTIGEPYADRRIKRALHYVGVDFQSFEYLVRVGRTVVGRASIDRAEVESTMRAVGYERDGEHEGFDRYRRENAADLPGVTVAVGDELVLFARGRPDAVDEVIDTGGGRRARRYETDDAFARLADHLGAYPVTTFSRGRSDESAEVLAGGNGVVFDDEYAYRVAKSVYADENDVSRDELEREIEESPRALDATRIDLRIDGSIVTVVLQLDHETFAEMYGPLYEYPYVTWGFDYDREREAIRLAHRAGDAVDASLFTLLDTHADGPADEQFSDRYETIEAGDSLTVDVSGRDEWHFRLDGTIPGTDETWTEFNVGDARFDRVNRR